MELKDFVKKTIMDIAEAIEEANKESTANIVVNPNKIINAGTGHARTTGDEVLKQSNSRPVEKGSTQTKLKSLADDINVLAEDDQIENIAKTASKEKGVDLFGWLPFNDKIPNMLMLAVQCACGEKTGNKINEPENYLSYMHFRKFKMDPLVVLSVPKAVTIGENNIKDHTEVMKKDSLFLDRSRLLEYTPEDMKGLEDLQSFVLADKLIEKTISVVD